MLSLLASSEYRLAVCVRAGIVRVSVGLPSLYRTFFIIGGMDCLFLRLHLVLLLAFIGFALTASRSFIFADTGVGMYIVRGLACMEYPFS